MNDYEKIPRQLKKIRSWVNVSRNSKVPINVRTGRGASPSDPETWGTFQEAVENVKSGKYADIGYVFHNNGLVGIDIDAGRDADGFLSPLAIDIINTCQSYTEWSRSGRGVHILLLAYLPFAGQNNRNGVEMYADKRYFIMTGRNFVHPEIKENQPAVDYIIEKYFKDAPKADSPRVMRKVYEPIYKKPEGGKITFEVEYPDIQPGSRNLCLTSLAGQLHSKGFSREMIRDELLKCNLTACKPPLPKAEVLSIVKSVMRYKK